MSYARRVGCRYLRGRVADGEESTIGPPVYVLPSTDELVHGLECPQTRELRTVLTSTATGVSSFLSLL